MLAQLKTVEKTVNFHGKHEIVLVTPNFWTVAYKLYTVWRISHYPTTVVKSDRWCECEKVYGPEYALTQLV